eukprot:SAG11_NODE_10471_length_829_cov_1.287671_1_plen_33_part_10
MLVLNLFQLTAAHDLDGGRLDALGLYDTVGSGG